MMWVVHAGRWLTKRRGVLLAPLFAITLLGAHTAPWMWLEALQDIVGFVCLVAGTQLRLVAASYHESQHQSEPITAGPYTWVRHPLYLANFLLGLGIVLLAGWWPMVLAYSIFFIPTHLAIAYSEEEHLIDLYGEKYVRYRRLVPAFFPWHRFPGPCYGSRSTQKLKQGQEMLKAFGYVAAAAGILLFKQLRPVLNRFSSLRLFLLHPISQAILLAAGIIAFLGILFRPQIRPSWLRTFETALVVCVGLLLAISFVPGVWPTAK